MKEYRMINRLQSDEYIGENHIAVKQLHVKRYPQHWHNYFEIELILSGSAMHTYNGSESTIERYDAYLLTPVDFHGMEAQDSVEVLNISFDDVSLSPSMLSLLSAPELPKLCRFRPEEFDRVVMAAELLRHECNCNGPCKMQLLEYMLSCFARQSPERTAQQPEKKHLQGLKKAISYIELHFREPISLQQLAALSGYNPSYFSELFRKATGQTYKERILSLRVSYAQMLLANGLTVSETCFASGFGSLSNFAAAFRKKCGMSPNAYRKHMRDGEAS